MAIHIQKQTVIKCSLSLSVETFVFSSLACNGKLSVFCICLIAHYTEFHAFMRNFFPNSSFVFVMTLSLVSFLFIKALQQPWVTNELP